MEKNIYFKTLKLIGSKGLRFTTEDLAAELATSKRTIYTYFSSKDEIIGKTIDFVFDEIQSADKLILEDETLLFNEKLALCFKNMPDAYNLSAIVRHMDDLKRHYPDIWTKVNQKLDDLWDGVIDLIETGIKNDEIQEVNTVILRVMLNETMKKLLDYDFFLNNQISFESGLQSIRDIVLYGVIKR